MSTEGVFRREETDCIKIDTQTEEQRLIIQRKGEGNGWKDYLNKFSCVSPGQDDGHV